MKSKEEIEYRKRLEILENHLGSDFYKIGQYHMNISNAMEEYKNEPVVIEGSEVEKIESFIKCRVEEYVCDKGKNHLGDGRKYVFYSMSSLRTFVEDALFDIYPKPLSTTNKEQSNVTDELQSDIRNKLSPIANLCEILKKATIKPPIGK